VKDQRFVLSASLSVLTTDLTRALVSEALSEMLKEAASVLARGLLREPRSMPMGSTSVTV
jgi:hypothetical protein